MTVLKPYGLGTSVAICWYISENAFAMQVSNVLVFVCMLNDNGQLMLTNLRAILADKGDAIRPEDLLIPELQWIINCTALSAVDRRFAELRYIKGMKSKDIMEELEWYSTKTFTRHNKKVWANLVQTLHRLVD